MPSLIAQVIGMRRNIPTQPKPLPDAHTSCATVGPDGLLVGSVVHVTEEVALAEDVRPDGLGQQPHLQCLHALLLRISYQVKDRVRNTISQYLIEKAIQIVSMQSSYWLT